ncbi:hypothetical protein [Methylorubrum thiocyanatum]
MSERGVFAVDRGLWSDPDFADEPFSEREAFLWLLSEAAWRPTSVRIGHHRVELDRGQCAFSTRFMAEKWKWSEARVRRYLGRLISAEIVCTRTDKIATHITIRNYNKFQRVSLPDAEDATHVRRTSDAPETHLRRKEEDRETKETNTPTDAIASSAPKGASRQRGTRIPDGFEHSAEAREVAAAFGLTGAAADEALAEFADYWRPLPGLKATKLDWIGTLRNQMRKVSRRGPAARAGPHRPRSSNGYFDLLRDELAGSDDQRSDPQHRQHLRLASGAR